MSKNNMNFGFISCFSISLISLANCSKTEFTSGKTVRSNAVANNTPASSDVETENPIPSESQFASQEPNQTPKDPTEVKDTDPNTPVTPTENPCPNGEFNYKPVLNFESITGASEGKLVDTGINTILETDYGVSFKSINGGTLALAKVAKKGEPSPLFHAWMSVLCYDKSQYNLLCNGGDAGSWLLSTNKSMATNRIEFEISFKGPTKEVSFDLADFDGGEVWNVTPYDAVGKILPGALNLKSTDGYSTDTGNNALKRFNVSTSSHDIQKLHFLGTKNITIFGFGIDNITTGISNCIK